MDTDKVELITGGMKLILDADEIIKKGRKIIMDIDKIVENLKLELKDHDWFVTITKHFKDNTSHPSLHLMFYVTSEEEAKKIIQTSYEGFQTIITEVPKIDIT